MELTKKNIYTILGVLAFFILLFIGILFAIKYERIKFKREGVKTNASIIYKYVKEVRSTNSKGRTIINYDKMFTLYYSTRQKHSITEDTLGNYKLSGDELLDKVFNQISFKNIHFVKKDISVSNSDYEKYKVGDEFPIYFLKSDSTDIRTASFVESTSVF
ncbi:MAG: hypothetical protein WCP57_06815 [Bacteroidota bacterium]|jgi:hypothetical protein